MVSAPSSQMFTLHEFRIVSDIFDTTYDFADDNSIPMQIYMVGRRK